MLLQAHSMAEGFATDVTGKGPGSAVRAADMHFQPMRGGEHLRQSKESGPRKEASLWAAWPWAELQSRMEREKGTPLAVLLLCCVSHGVAYLSLAVSCL